MKIRNILISIVLFILLVSSVSGQQSKFSTVFYDDNGAVQGYSIVKSADHKYMLAGGRDTILNSGSLKPWLMKVDTNGSMLWGKIVGPGKGVFNALISTSDSCLVLVGSLGDNSSAATDALIMKINSAGDTLWSRTFDAGGIESALAIIETFDHGYIVTGVTKQPITQAGEAFIIKISAAGNLIWSKISATGSGWAQVNGISQTQDTNYIITGNIGNQPFSFALLMMIDRNGSPVWIKSIGFTIGFDVVSVSDGFIWYGENEFIGYDTPVDFLLIKTDFAGNIVWQKSYQANENPGYSDGGPAPRLHLTSDGSVVFVTTEPGSPVWTTQLVKAASDGSIVWYNEIGCSGKDICLTEDGGFLAIGNGPLHAISMFLPFTPQVGIIKTNSDGMSVYCSWPVPYSNDSLNAELVDDQFPLISGGALSVIHPQITTTILNSVSGCVNTTPVVEEHSANDTPKIYPNPSSGPLYIDGSPTYGNSAQVIIYNMMGTRIYDTREPVILPGTIDLTGFADGIYNLQLVFPGKTFAKSFIIRH